MVTRFAVVFGVLGVVACSKSEDPGTDPDANPMADPARIRVVNPVGQPVANYAVIFHDAAGAAIGSAKTDDSGSVENPLTSDGWLTFAKTTTPSDGDGGGEHALWTRPLAARQELTFVVFPEVAIGEPVGSVTVTLAQPFEGATKYSVQARINGDPLVSEVTTIPVPAFGHELADRERTSVIVYALNDDDAPLAYAYAKDVDLAPLKAATPTDVAVTLTEWKNDFDFAVMTLTDYPAGALDATRLWLRVDESADPPYPAPAMPAPPLDGSSAVRQLFVTPGFATSYRIDDGYMALDGGLTARSRIVDSVPVALDGAASDLLVPPSAVSPDLSSARPVVTWAGENPDADVVEVAATWLNGDGSLARWQFELPADATGPRFPELPGEFASLVDGIGQTLVVEVAYMDVGSIVGFEEFYEFAQPGLDHLTVGNTLRAAFGLYQAPMPMPRRVRGRAAHTSVRALHHGTRRR